MTQRKKTLSNQYIVRKGKAIERQQLLNRSVNYRVLAYSPINKPRPQDYYIQTIKQLQQQIAKLNQQPHNNVSIYYGETKLEVQLHKLEREKQRLEELLKQKQIQISKKDLQLKKAYQTITYLQMRQNLLNDSLFQKKRIINADSQLFKTNKYQYEQDNSQQHPLLLKNIDIKQITSIQQIYEFNYDQNLKKQKNISVPIMHRKTINSETLSMNSSQSSRDSIEKVHSPKMNNYIFKQNIQSNYGSRLNYPMQIINSIKHQKINKTS